jgi:hypothetical protein
MIEIKEMGPSSVNNINKGGTVLKSAHQRI